MSSMRVLTGRPMSRRAFMQRAAAAGVGLSALGALMASCADDDGPDRPLTPAFYDWILSLFPTQAVSDSWDQEVNVQTAPVEGFGIERFVAEGEEGESTWDVYVGMTPFVEMAALIDAGVIEPWDPYLADGVADTWVPSVRAEATYDGQIYSHPFDSSIVAAGWHGGLVAAAGLDPDYAPPTWDDWLASARQVMDSGAAPFGATFDANGWRSLAPIAHSIDINVYTDEGRFDFTHDAVIEALEIMRRLMEVSNPDVLGQGATDAGANVTPDEGAFAGEKAAYYFKHAFGPINMSSKWTDPSQLRLGAIPTVPGGSGGTVFWSTGAGLFTYGGNKEQAAEYMHYLTSHEDIHRADVGNQGGVVGQLQPYQTIWDEWRANPPSWLANWAFALQDQLGRASAIHTHVAGVTQFQIGRPHWETYLTGDVSTAREALQAAKDAVLAETA